MAISITSPATANITDTSTSVSLSWSGATTGANWRVEGVLLVGGIVITTFNVAATASGTGTLAIAANQTKIYNAATGKSLTGTVTLRINNYLDVTPFTNYTVNRTGGTLTIAKRLSGAENTTGAYTINNFDGTSTYNWVATWSRPHTAFRARVKIYMNGVYQTLYQGFGTSMSRTPTVAEANAMISAMGSNTSANMYYVIETGFVADTTVYYTSGALTTGNVSITKLNPSFTAPANANITDTSASVTASWSGGMSSTLGWTMSGALRINGTTISTFSVASAATGSQTLAIAANQAAIYSAATGSSLNGAVSIVLTNTLASPSLSSSTTLSGGNLTIANRLTNASNTTSTSYNMNTFNSGSATYNWKATWTRPHSAFRARVKVYVGATLIATYDGLADSITQAPSDSQAYSMISAMGSNTSANLSYTIETGFVSDVTSYYTTGAISTGNTSITRSFLAISSPANANITDTSSSVSVSWNNGMAFGSWRVSGSLRINGVTVSTFDVASTGTGTQTLAISANQGAIYDAATGKALANSVSIVLSNYLSSPALNSSSTLSNGTLTIANRLTSATNTTVNPYNLDTFNGTSTYNWVAGWTRPHTAFRARVNIYVNSTLIATYTNFTTSMSRLPTSAEVATMGTAMAGVSPRTIYYTIETGFVADSTVYYTTGALTTPTTSITKTFLQPSTISISNFTLSSETTAVPFTLSVGTSGATHEVRLYVRVGSTDTLIRTHTGITTSGNFTIGSTERNLILNAMPSSVVATTWAWVEASYNSFTALSNSQSTATNLTLDESYKPVIGTITWAETNSYMASITSSLYFLTSKSNITFTVPATMAIGATRTSTRVQFAGTDNTTTGAGTTRATGALQSPGTLSYTITVSDSRGRSTAITAGSIIVRAYTPPIIINFTMNRVSTSNPAINDPLGTRARASLNVAATKVENESGVDVNRIRWVLEYRERPLTSWSVYSSNVSNTTLTINTTSSLTSPTFLITKSYDFRLRAYDRFYDLNHNSTLDDSDDFAQSIVILPFGKVSMMIGVDNVAIGKVWTNGVLDVGGDIYTNGTKVPTLLDVYPVGAVYISVLSTSPATLFGGTWQAFGTGRTLIGIDTGDTDFNTVEKTSGSKTHTHTSAAHTHTIASHTHSVGAHSHSIAQHTHTVPAHAHSVGAHSHSIAQHDHTMAHTHSVGAHAHSIDAHSHTLSSAGRALLNITTGYAYMQGSADSAWTANDRLAGTRTGTTVSQSWSAHLRGNTDSGGPTSTGNSTAFNTGASSASNTGTGGPTSTDNSTAFNTGNSSELTSGIGGPTSTGNSTAFNTSGTSLTTDSTTPGSTGSSSSLQPYIVVYMWKRTA